MRHIGNRILLMILGLTFGAGAGATDNAVNAAVRWLGSVQFRAGAIGGRQAGLAETAVAAAALRTAGVRGATYYRALTYLENHAGGNADFESRRILALAPALIIIPASGVRSQGFQP